jgi:hypothetical protein
VISRHRDLSQRWVQQLWLLAPRMRGRMGLAHACLVSLPTLARLLTYLAPIGRNERYPGRNGVT